MCSGPYGYGYINGYKYAFARNAYGYPGACCGVGRYGLYGGYGPYGGYGGYGGWGGWGY